MLSDHLSHNLIIEFVPLARRYTNLVMSMPPNYQKTLHHLQDHISDDQISTILECRDYVTSNKMILDCLVMKVHCKDDLLNLCDQLSNVTGSPTMLGLVNDIRKGRKQLADLECL